MDVKPSHAVEWVGLLVPTIRYIVNFCLTSGQFQPILKESVISPLLKKSTIIIERVLKSRLIDHLTSNKHLIITSLPIVKYKHYSTETTLLYIHDHLINAIGSQKVSSLCLLDLSAAFNTIDHNHSKSTVSYI